MITLRFPFRCISKDNFGRFGNGRFYRDSKFKAFENKIALYTKQQYKGNILDRDIDIVLLAFFKDKRHPDCTNLPKGVFDALQGLIYANDRQIKKATIEVYENQPQDKFEVIVKNI